MVQRDGDDAINMVIGVVTETRQGWTGQDWTGLDRTEQEGMQITNDLKM